MNSQRVFRHISGFWSEERNLSLLLGIIIFDLFVLPSLAESIGGSPGMDLLSNAAFSLLMLTGLISLTRYKSIQRVFAVVVALIVLARWGRLLFGGTWLAGWDIFFTLVSAIAFAVIILGHVFKEGPMTGHRIQGAIAAYLLIALAFSFAYFLVEFINPNSFQFHTQRMLIDEHSWKVFYYFSIATLTTLGYGDIVPLSPTARNITMAEALVGQLYPAILIARLVSLHVETRRHKKEE